jgi:hypothetical protein
MGYFLNKKIIKNKSNSFSTYLYDLSLRCIAFLNSVVYVMSQKATLWTTYIQQY